MTTRPMTVRELLVTLLTNFDMEEVVVAPLWSASDLLKANEVIHTNTGIPSLSDADVHKVWVDKIAQYVAESLGSGVLEIENELIDQIAYIQEGEN